MDHVVTKKRVVLGAVLTAVAVGAVALFVPMLRARSAVSLSFHCAPGEARIHTLSYSSEGKLLDPAFGLGGDQGGSKPEQSVRAKVDGKLAVACIASSDTEHTVSLSFENPTGTFSVQTENGDGPMSALLAGETFVTRDALGHTKSIRFPESMPDKGRNLVREMLALGQVTLPGSVSAGAGAPEPMADAKTWTAREETMNGAFDASYTVKAVQGDRVTLTKSLRPSGEAGRLHGEVMRPRVEQIDERASEFRVSRADGAVEGADVAVALVLKVGSRRIGETKARLVLAHVEKRTLSESELAMRARALEGAAAAGSPASDLAASDVDARLERNMQEKELGSDDWRTLSARNSDVEPTKTYLKMKALFFLHPESCDQARRALTAMDDPNAARFQRVAAALASAGTPESQAALVSALRASDGKRAKEHALLGAMGFVKKPTAETMKVLDDIVSAKGDDEVRSTARFARASLAGQGADPNTPQARAVVKSEVAAYRSATGGEERTTALLALGNTGSQDVLDVAREALADSDPQVRAAGAASLRFVAAGEAEDLLVRVAANDSASAVRAEALRSLGLRILGEPAVQTVAGLAKADLEEDVRMMAVQVLARELDRDPGLEGLLDDIAQTDRARGVRNAATMTLQRYRATRG
ncbi:HEAT repeat domain-containing protein [Pendulispora albinea]|uniref:HEAT repeat domain-containing protein n=1 Tax=Pendulispora albinea TaxID=2741071 RepID=A0ABZ2LZZ2_9BACT